MRKLIGVHGQLGSGKDTVSNFIQKEFPEYNFVRRAFAYDVKKTVSLITGVSMETILTRKGKQIYVESFGKTIGEMLQLVGDQLRNFNKNVWIYSLFNKEDEDTNIIVTDVRYINEANYIKDNGGILIKIYGDPVGANVNDSRDLTHVSETELDGYDKWDIIFENKPPIENINNLIEQVRSIL